jgi:uncharacterized spore protein YtfJ
MFGRKRKGPDSESLRAPDGLEAFDLTGVQSEAAALAAITRLFDVYEPGVVFSEPTTVGDNTVITAAEVHVGMGLGFGHGSGGDNGNEGEGTGGGGGGASAGRPVAAIIVSPHGVRVEPVVDVTKISLAFFTMLGAIFMSWRAMRRQSRSGRS